MRAVLALLLLLLGQALLGAPPAQAQGLFDFLFRPTPRPQPEVVRPEPIRPRPAPVKPKRPKPRASPFATPAPEKVQAEPKEPEVPPSVFVNVIGDSLAELLADGLSIQLQDRPDIAVVPRTKSSSGIVRDDYYDWNKELARLLASGEEIAAVVIMIGANDRQPLREGEDAFEPRSDEWRDAYVKRVDALLAQLKAKNIKTYWVGLPPMRSPRLNADIVWFNEIYRERAEAAGATYVDIWDSFVDEDGEYTTSGPDLNGQVAKLRAGDGVHFSKAGAQVAAHYVERELRRALGQAPLAATPAPTALAPATPEDAAANATPEVGGAAEAPEPEKPEFGPVQPLDQADLSTNGVLLGGAPAAPSQVASSAPRIASPPLSPAADPSAAKVLVRGEALAPREGRADDFRWPRPSAEEQPLKTSSRPAGPGPAAR